MNKEEEEEKELDEELKLKRRVHCFFSIIIISITAIGAATLCFCIKITEPTGNIQIAIMGFFMIIILTLGILGFVGSMYLAHPKSWSTIMIDKGRTLEYITVILIVGTVLILALLEILKPEIIGTILGAIAGFVLGKAVTPKG